MNEIVSNLKYVFEPKSVAVVGASRSIEKIGNVIVRNLVEGPYNGEIYPVNPSAESILGRKCYPDLKSIRKEVECIVVATPMPTVKGIMEQAEEIGVKGAVVITGGFGEVGNMQQEKEVAEIAKRAGIAMIGPNCMGTINIATGVDSVFLPFYKMGRPRKGGASFISQSGAVGGMIVDMSSYYSVGMSKFVSYGNASVIDESDLLEYLMQDRSTREIVIYVEGVKDGKRFFRLLNECRKPVIALKGGRHSEVEEAVKTHTSAIAGSYETYKAVFKQAGAVEVQDVDELFYVYKVFSQPRMAGARIGVVSNGGGVGIITADEVVDGGLELAKLSPESLRRLREVIPPYIKVKNPADTGGDSNATRIRSAVEAMLLDPNVDAIVIALLFQTISLDSTVVDALVGLSQEAKKPMVVVASGGEYTQQNRKILDSYGIPTYPTPRIAVKALNALLSYWRKKG
ncbi:MAG: CoA-binding protein [Candidatus Anstonellales archaeon]